MTRRDKDVQKWIEANPVELVNVSSVGTRCGRAASIEEAKAKIESNPHATFVGVRGNQVLFSEPLCC